MNTVLAIVIFCEILLTLFVCWGWAHEELFIRAEDMIIERIKARVKRGKQS